MFAIGKMAVAFLAGARPDIVTQNGNLAKSNIDVRLLRFQGTRIWGVLGALVGWFDYATAKGGTDPNGHSSSHHRRLRLRDAPSTPGVARRLSHLFHPVRNRRGQQLQHIHR